MTFDKTLSLVTGLLLAVILLAGGAALYSGARQSVEASQSQTIAGTGTLLSTSILQASTLALSHAELVAREPQVIAALKAGNRDAVKALVGPTFALLKQEADVSALHVHTADMHSFFRAQEPDSFGQDLSKSRPLILAANKSGRNLKGLENGRAGLAIRGIAVIRDGDSLIGTVEVGLGIEPLMEVAKSQSGAEFAIFLKPEVVNEFPRNDGAAASGPVLDSATDAKLFEGLARDGVVSFSLAPVMNKVTLADRRLGVYSQPLLDFSGRLIGTMLVVQDLTATEHSFTSSVVTLIAVALCGFLAAFAGVMITLRTGVIRPLADLAARLRKTADTDETADVAEPKGFAEFEAVKEAADALIARSNAHSGDGI